MSWQDDYDAEIDEYLDHAEDKVLWGRNYSPAYVLAKRIRAVWMLFSKNCGEERHPKEELRKSQCKINEVLVNILRDRKIGFEEREFLLAGLWLLVGAVLDTKKLRAVADALDAMGSEVRTDPRHVKILEVYRQCCDTSFPPTLTEIRAAFVKRHGEPQWRSDRSVRKTIKMLGLPLNKAKPGRPRGSRSKIGNPRR